MKLGGPDVLGADKWDPKTAEALQTLLRNAGFYKGKISGTMNGDVETAMQALCNCSK
ncbi:MAG: hypothetical protein JKY49_18645 [Cohaesibacteraceae bacterium]|nr:hypothetical protein [Cohaesibacteraceae bacterium]